MSISNSVLDTRFRAALNRMAEDGRLLAYTAPADPELEIASIMKDQDGGPALLFTSVKGHDVPVVGNILSCQENCESAFGVDFRGIRTFIGRALGDPKPPVLVQNAPAQQNVHTKDIDLGRMFPVLKHTAADNGRFITAGIVIVKDPDTNTYNASYHRLQIAGDRTGVKLDFGRHLRLAWERAKAKNQALPIVVCIGTDLALQYTAATMGSQMPEHADELAVAGGLCGRPLSVVKAVTQEDLLVPAETEIVLEGRMLPEEMMDEGPFGEFVGYMAPAAPSPVFEITAVTHRDNPVYHAINGYGRETIMLRKYVLEASLLKVLQPAVPIVVDAEMTAGGLHRFHAVVQVKKTSPHHDGLQRNAIMAAFGALKDLDMVIVVDDDIDLRNPLDVEYALAMRMEASRDLFVMPGARGHEYVRVGNNGMQAKLGIDATVPFAEKDRFKRASFEPVTVDAKNLSGDVALMMDRLKL